MHVKIIFLERTQIEKDEAERDLKIILEKKKSAEREIAKQSQAIRQRQIEEEKVIKGTSAFKTQLEYRDGMGMRH